MKHLRKELWWARIKFFALIVLVVAGALVMMSWGAWSTSISYNRLGVEQLLFGLGAIALGYGFCRLHDRVEEVFKRKTKKLICRMLNFKKGIAGEDAVKKKFESIFGPEYTVIESYDT